MMPLAFVNVGETKVIVKVNGNDETRHHLSNLGFVEGAEITVVSELAGNIIVNVKDTRVAIDKAMAGRIIV